MRVPWPATSSGTPLAKSVRAAGVSVAVMILPFAPGGVRGRTIIPKHRDKRASLRRLAILRSVGPASLDATILGHERTSVLEDHRQIELALQELTSSKRPPRTFTS